MMTLNWARFSERQIFWCVMLVAAVIRAASSIPFRIGWYDEIWQYLEPAWSIVEGPWIQTWDFRDGIRSWMLPQIVSVPMALGHGLSPDSDLHLLLPRLMMAVTSLLVVGCATSLGLRLSRLHGVFAGVVSAVWFELVFFAPRVLAEPLAFSLLMGAVWLLVARRTEPAARHFLIAGMLIGLSFVVRIQYAPALLLLVLGTAKLNVRGAWVPLILGGLVALGVDAAANLSMGATPFRWMVEAVRINIVEGRAKQYGVSPITGYLGMIALYWVIFFPVILLLLRKGARLYPLLFWMAVLHLACHSLIGHKEFRFIMASTGLLVILAALGTVEALRQVPRERFKMVTVGALLAWVGASIALGGAFFSPNWVMGQALAGVYEEVRTLPNSCGIAFHFPKRSVAASYVLYRKDDPLYGIDDPEELETNQTAYNLIVTDRSMLPVLPKNYVLHSCGDAGNMDAPVCIARREGGCSSQPTQHLYNEWLRRNDN